MLVDVLGDKEAEIIGPLHVECVGWEREVVDVDRVWADVRFEAGDVLGARGTHLPAPVEAIKELRPAPLLRTDAIGKDVGDSELQPPPPVDTASGYARVVACAGAPFLELAATAL